MVLPVLCSSGWISVAIGSAALGQDGPLNMHIGSAVRRECPFLLFQYLCIIKLIKKKKKPSNSHSHSSLNSQAAVVLWLESSTIPGRLVLMPSQPGVQLPEFSRLSATVIIIISQPSCMWEWSLAGSVLQTFCRCN